MALGRSAVILAVLLACGAADPVPPHPCPAGAARAALDAAPGVGLSAAAIDASACAGGAPAALVALYARASKPATAMTAFVPHDDVFAAGAADALSADDTAACAIGVADELVTMLSSLVVPGVAFNATAFVLRGEGASQVLQSATGAGDNIVLRAVNGQVVVSSALLSVDLVVTAEIELPASCGPQRANIYVVSPYSDEQQTVSAMSGPEMPPMPIAVCVKCQRNVRGAALGCSGPRHKELSGCIDGYRRVYDVVPAQHNAYFCAACSVVLAETNSFLPIVLCPASPLLYRDSGRCANVEHGVGQQGGAYRVAMPWELMLPYGSDPPPTASDVAACEACQRRCESQSSTDGYLCCMRKRCPDRPCFASFLAPHVAAGDVGAFCADFAG